MRLSNSQQDCKGLQWPGAAAAGFIENFCPRGDFIARCRDARIDGSNHRSLAFMATGQRRCHAEAIWHVQSFGHPTMTIKSAVNSRSS